MKILLVDECYPLNTRNVKILSSLSLVYPACEIHVLTWDREGMYDAEKEDKCDWHWHLYTRPATYGNKFQKLSGLLGYRSFCCKQIKRIVPDVVIASHWNNLLMLPKLDNDKQMLVYENLDAPTGPAIVRRMLNRIEYFYMSHSLTVHASRFYTDLYPARFRQVVLENKPVIDTTPVDYSPKKPLRIAYLGNIRYIEILKNLADAVRNDERFCLSYHGGGPDYESLKAYVAGAGNIHMTGPYRYDDIEQLYRNTDLIWAAYPNRDFNVKYAISNKFHESLAYAIPAIYANETCLGAYATSSVLGFQINPYSVEAIKELLSSIVSNDKQLVYVHESLKKQLLNETSWAEDFRNIKREIDAFFDH